MKHILAFLLMMVASIAAGGERVLDWSAWQRVPVLDGGRLMPLDSFARSRVKRICGTPHPTLSLAGAAALGPTATNDMTAAMTLFPGGSARSFSAAELLFAWLAEPQKWELVPFLPAADPQLRSELLGLPLVDEAGHKLTGVSPQQVLAAAKFRARLVELDQRQEAAKKDGKPLEPAGVDLKVQDLYEAYTLYRRLTYNPVAPSEIRGRFLDKLSAGAHLWQELAPSVLRVAAVDEKSPASHAAEEAGDSLQRLLALVEQGGPHDHEPTLAELDPLAASWQQATATLAGHLGTLRERMGQSSGQVSKEQFARFRQWMDDLADHTNDLARLAAQAHAALYDPGDALRLVPSLDAAALEADRDPEDDTPPWLSLATLLDGSDALLDAYPQSPLQAVRKSYRAAVAAYVDRGNPAQAEHFAAAMQDFAAALRSFGEATEPLRDRLPIVEKDPAIMAATAYPPPGATAAEVLYNTLAPFEQAWLCGLVAVVCLTISTFALRRLMFWAGLGALAATTLATFTGIALRVHITRWGPITNMFETVVFVALFVSALGLWFTLVPLLWPGVSSAWRWAGIWQPFAPAAPLPLRERVVAQRPGEGEPSPRPRWQSQWHTVIWLVRVLLAGYLLYLSGVLQSGPATAGYRLTTLLPRTDLGAAWPSLSNVLVWASSMCVVLIAVGFVSRLAMAALLSPPLVVYHLRRTDCGRLVEQVHARKVIALAAAAVALVALLTACYAPESVFIREIVALRPVLRNKFWLWVHVTTIVSSYAVAAAACALGIVAIFYYLLGRYGEASEASVPVAWENGGGPAAVRGSRAPAAIGPLARWIYKLIQVAAILLCTGTILGGLWADVSWGRFWGWDPKEVWALISLLVYMVILHGRYFGWPGNFSLVIGSVLGFTAIIWAWYGVNFLMPGGKHSYGEGAGGQIGMAVILLLTWLLMAAATVRYLARTKAPPSD